MVNCVTPSNLFQTFQPWQGWKEGRIWWWRWQRTRTGIIPLNPKTYCVPNQDKITFWWQCVSPQFVVPAGRTFGRSSRCCAFGWRWWGWWKKNGFSRRDVARVCLPAQKFLPGDWAQFEGILVFVIENSRFSTLWFQCRPHKHMILQPFEVKSCTVVFDENTVYGSRNGAHSCLLITANDKNNTFWKSKAWRCGVISGAAMLPRSEMLKVEKTAKGFATEGKLTRVQEMKQAGLHPQDSNRIHLILQGHSSALFYLWLFQKGFKKQHKLGLQLGCFEIIN